MTVFKAVDKRLLRSLVQTTNAEEKQRDTTTQKQSSVVNNNANTEDTIGHTKKSTEKQPHAPVATRRMNVTEMMKETVFQEIGQHKLALRENRILKVQYFNCVLVVICWVFAVLEVFFALEKFLLFLVHFSQNELVYSCDLQKLREDNLNPTPSFAPLIYSYSSCSTYTIMSICKAVIMLSSLCLVAGVSFNFYQTRIITTAQRGDTSTNPESGRKLIFIHFCRSAPPISSPAISGQIFSDRICNVLCFRAARSQQTNRTDM